MTIGAFAAAADVNVETIRFYQRRGLIREPARRFGSVRRYDPVDVARVRFVKTAQGLGFSLAEVAGLLQLEDGTHCDEAHDIAREKLKNVRGKLTHLQTIERSLSALVTACSGATGRVRCPLIEALGGGGHATSEQASAVGGGRHLVPLAASKNRTPLSAPARKRGGKKRAKPGDLL